MRLTGELQIKCSRCNQDYTFDSYDFEYESSVCGEGNMGTRVQHSFLVNFECDRCRQMIDVELICYEYPDNSIDYTDEKHTGCSILEYPEFEIEFDFPEEFLSIYDQILMDPASVHNLSGWDFEELVAEVYRRHGFSASVTQKTRDGGKDIFATCAQGGITYTSYFQCKQQNAPVGVSVVRELYGVLERDGIDKGIIVTSSRFTRDAIHEADRLNGRIVLIDFERLRELMQQRGF